MHAFFISAMLVSNDVGGRDTALVFVLFGVYIYHVGVVASGRAGCHRAPSATCHIGCTLRACDKSDGHASFLCVRTRL